jgi:fermentation-respiration switch protein FrsA (DUF1100 family)
MSPDETNPMAAGAEPASPVATGAEPAVPSAVSAAFTRRDVRFWSEGLSCAAWYYVPSDLIQGEPRPAIVMAHGFSAVKEMCLDRFAERFAAAGFVVLVFDYRCFGASDGLPRGRLLYYEQHRDYRNAITWASLQPEVDRDRIGVWGTSFGGGHVLHLAAFDRRIRAVVAQVPATNTWETYFKKLKSKALAERSAWLASTRREEYVTGQVSYFPIVAKKDEAGKTPSCVMPQPGAYAWFTETAQRCAPNWRNMVTVESLEINAEYAPVSYINLIAPTPLLMLVAKEDDVTPVEAQRKAFARARPPKLLIELPGGHFDGYQAPGFDSFAAPAVQWFQQYLSPYSH